MTGPSLKVRSFQMRLRNLARRLLRGLIASAAVLLGATILGLVSGGIGIEGVLFAQLGMFLAFWIFVLFPFGSRPSLEKLREVKLSELADHTLAWLVDQRNRLPRQAIRSVERIGYDLDQLSPQLARLEDNGPAAAEVRKLLGEHLPTLVESYTSIPDRLRQIPHAGSTPQEQLVDGLDIISREIETLTRQISAGELDRLAIRGRYLELRYITAASEDERR